jgi:hypothetical protein
MAVREFDGTDDAIVFSPGSTVGLSAPISAAVVFKRNETVDSILLAAAQNATTTSDTFSERFKGYIRANANNDVTWGTPTTTDSAETLVNADGWALIVLTKASGSALPRVHRHIFGGSTTRSNCGANSANMTALDSSSRWEVGKDEFTNHTACRIAVAAVWGVQLTDGQVDEIASDLSTQSMYENTGGTPLALWDFNQASTATAVTDLTGGGADQLAITGTTVIADGVDDPPGWTFGLEAEQWPPEGTDNAPETLRVVQANLRFT